MNVCFVIVLAWVLSDFAQKKSLFSGLFFVFVCLVLYRGKISILHMGSLPRELPSKREAEGVVLFCILHFALFYHLSTRARVSLVELAAARERKVG